MSEEKMPAAGQPDIEASDNEAFSPGFGKGGVPWYLLVFYVAFLVFFTWYTTEFQLPGLVQDGPAQNAEGEASVANEPAEDE